MNVAAPTFKKLLYVLVLPILVFAVITGVLGLYFVQVAELPLWQEMPLGLAGQQEEFCERNLMDQNIRERANTWSNLSYLFFGLVCMGFATYDKIEQPTSPANFIIRFPILSLVTAAAFFYLFIGSFFYHASLTRYWQVFDLSGVYALAMLPLAYNIFRFVYYKTPCKTEQLQRAMVYGFALLVVLVNVLIYFTEVAMLSRSFLGIVLIAILLSTIFYNRFTKSPQRVVLMSSPYLATALAFTIWILDQQKIVCDPDSLLQGHAIWHFLTALGGFLFYIYFRSEKVNLG